MTDNRRKWKDEAAQLLLKGRYEKALGLYQKVLEQNPEDDGCQSKVGYILQRLGRRQEAIDVQVKLANWYADRGFMLKAIAACKVVLEIDPGHTQVQRKLADLYACRSAAQPRAGVKVLADEGSAPAPDGGDISGMSTDPIELPPALDDLPGMVLLDATTPATELPVIPETAGSQDPAPLPLLAPEVIEPEAPGQDSAPPVPAAAEPEPPKQELLLPEIPLFSDLAPDAFVAVLEQMRLVRVRAGEWILREGASGSSMFTIAKGSVRVLRWQEGNQYLQLATLGEGAFFGEMAVLRGGVRGASVQATTDGELFEISKELLDQVVGQYPAVAEVLKKFARQRLLRNVMATSPLFKPFEAGERVHIIERFVSRDVTAGEELVTEGKESDGLYLVLRGKLEVQRRLPNGAAAVVGVLQEGEVFGEISCLHQEPAMATVRAQGAGTVLRLPRQSFSELILSHPQILEMVNQLGEQHLALTQNALAKKGVMI